MERVGVIGLGRMGSAIAQRMSAQGSSVLGWTRSGRKADGVESVATLAELAKNSDTLILSLFDDHAVSAVLDTLLECDLEGKQIIETSTVVPDLLKDRISRLTKLGVTAVDAPISGGPELVLQGKCGIFIGGETDAAVRAQDSLKAISNRIFHVGPLGAGLAMKTINNGMLQTYFNGLADFMPMAKRAGLPLETALRILCGGPAGIPMITDRIDKVLGTDTDVGFTINATLKDNIVFKKVVESFGLESPMLDGYNQVSGGAIDAGFGEHDVAALINLAYTKGENT